MIKTALTAALVLVSASAALATDFDPNLENRYPQASARFQGSDVAMTGNQTIVRTPAFQSTFDRASNPYAGGGL